jgi:hypothetical protein
MKYEKLKLFQYTKQSSPQKQNRKHINPNHKYKVVMCGACCESKFSSVQDTSTVVLEQNSNKQKQAGSEIVTVP